MGNGDMENAESEFFSMEYAPGACLGQVPGEELTFLFRLARVGIPMVCFFASMIIFAWWYMSASSKDTEPMEPITPDISSKHRLLCMASPEWCCASACELPALYTKPEEYLGTWYMNCFLFTWPTNPRAGEPELTKTDRRCAMILVLITDLLFFMVVGRLILEIERAYDENIATISVVQDINSAINTANASYGNSSSGVNYTVDTSGVNLTTDNEAVNAINEHKSEALLVFWHLCFEGFFASLIGTFLVWLLMKVFRAIETLKSKTHPKISIVTCIFCNVYLALAWFLVWWTMARQSCAACWYNMFMPFLYGFPIGLLLDVFGPWGYMMNNSFGVGLSVEEKLAEQEGGGESDK